MDLNFTSIAEKWQQRWRESKIFEPLVDTNKKPFYIQVAYPYPSGAMHIGHARTYSMTDIIARYHRLKGQNVLMPMGWHVSGTPVLASVEALQRNEQDVIDRMTKTFRIPKNDIELLKTPEGFVDYFVNKAKMGYKEGFKRLGLSIDWTRELTTIDPQYNKFIEWQYEKLYESELVKKGKYPVRFDPIARMAVGDHDLKKGEGIAITEYVMIKFKCDDFYLVAATLRPETVFGQTNLWVNPKIDYLLLEVGNEKWVVSLECYEKLKHQFDSIEQLGIIKGKDLVGKHCLAPGLEKEVIILPADFCDPTIGTGIVTSVPSHAPFDWQALVDLKNHPMYVQEFNLDHKKIKEIEPISLIKLEGYGIHPAQDFCEKNNVTSIQDSEKLEKGKKEIYKAEHHKGIMKENAGKYSGLKVAEAKKKVRNDLIEQNKAILFYELDGEVISRMGNKVVVAVLEDQWFLDYDNEQWKMDSKNTLKNMNIIPEMYRTQYENIFDWLEDKPCTRARGLGTKFTWDESKVIEPLGDSTIYMAYFTISHLIKEIHPDLLTREVFDFIFLGKGSIEKINTEIGKEVLKEMKESFEYWYPLAFNVSAIELIPNHMSFSIFHHTAIFPENKRQEGTLNLGMLIIEGQKMSSSKGNVLLVNDMTDTLGADLVRLFLVNFVEPWQEMDWKQKEVDKGKKIVTNMLCDFYETAKQVKDSRDISELKLDDADNWFIAAFNGKMNNFVDSMDEFEVRKALQEIIFKFAQDIKWYDKRKPQNDDTKEAVYKYVIANWLKAVNPIMPHITQEIWTECLGRQGFLYNERILEDVKVEKKYLKIEEFVRDTASDIRSIKEIAKIEKPKKITILTAKPMLWDAVENVIKLKEDRPSFEKIIKILKDDEKIKKLGKDMVRIAKHLTKNFENYKEFGSKLDELSVLKSSVEMLENEFKCEIVIEEADIEKHEKSKNAFPLKPAIVIE